ncbi:ABC transporter ATP-binding protein [Isobaculum melis]|uniref:Oligopeptide transport system ATP-binding protein n=1 Tax=Isobaculum melis TaxID=142588 RepID=A0A1H9UGG1_9LACT|nr:ATP-binding cassette domain-containing protein [Isobaculum melis]SES08351.1 oligopeptide transport system ATP-binding protein [Isobaculum melis]
MTERKKMLEVKQLKQVFNAGSKNEVTAIHDMSFDIYEGEIFGLVGESGCGKSTTGRTLMKLYQATAGEIIFEGKEINHIKKRNELLAFRKNIQMIFQNPYASLNPRMTIMETIAGGIDVYQLAKTKEERREKVYELLELVGLSREFATRYPRELSGGQCQRVGIARALAVSPKFIIADEAISALDVSIQAQVVNLLKELKATKKLTYLFIAHDLSMVKYISDRIGVMNGGRLLELAPADELYQAPLHPYTESLLSAVPVPDPEEERVRERVTYDSAAHQYTDAEYPAMREITEGHFVYCTEEEVTSYQAKLKKKSKLYKWSNHETKKPLSHV